jgi:hypothetical protein
MRFRLSTSIRAGVIGTAVAAIGGCVHIEFFHPDVEGTYHIGEDRPFWSYEGQVQHITIATTITPQPQQTPSWCWAAASQMLLQSQDIDMSQYEIVRRAYGDTREAGGKSPLMVDALTGTFTTTDGKEIKLQAHRADGFPHNGFELLSSLEDNRPFIVDIGYYKDGKYKQGEPFAAHSLLVYGMTYQREGNSVKILSLDTIDPSFAIIQKDFKGYDAHQSMDAKMFGSIQGTLGIYRR